MRLPVYIGIVGSIYMAAFGTVLALAGPPATGPIETAAVVIGGSFAIAWFSTARAIQLSPAHAPRYLIPSIIHGAVLLFMAMATIAVLAKWDGPLLAS